MGIPVGKLNQLDARVSALEAGSGGGGLRLTGDVVGSQSGSTIPNTITNNAVSFAKFQEIGGQKLLGNSDAGSDEIEEITLGTGLFFTGSTLNASGGGGGSGTAVEFFVDQTAHGFAEGDVVRLVAGSANTYTKAKADTAADAEVVGIVSTVTNANRFGITTNGIITNGVPAEAAGTVLFLSDATAGLLTSTEPTSTTSVSKPLAIVNESSVKMTMFNWRGMVITSSGGGGGSPLTVTEIDGTPSVANVTTIKVSNGTLTDNGSGVVTVTTGGGGGSGVGMENASGTVNGVNVTFTTVNSPIWVSVNGQILVAGDGYSVAGTYTLTFDSAPTGTPHSFYNL